MHILTILCLNIYVLMYIFIMPNKVFFRFPVKNVKNQYKSQIKLNATNTFLDSHCENRFQLRSRF